MGTQDEIMETLAIAFLRASKSQVKDLRSWDLLLPAEKEVFGNEETFENFKNRLWSDDLEGQTCFDFGDESGKV